MGLKWRFLVVAAFFRFSGPYERMIKYIVYVIRRDTTDLRQFFCIIYRNSMIPTTLFHELSKGKVWWVRKRLTENLVKKLIEENCLLRFDKFTNSGADTHELQCERILSAETIEERKRLLEEVDVYKKTNKLIYYQEL